jgi:hypothetical protein
MVRLENFAPPQTLLETTRGLLQMSVVRNSHFIPLTAHANNAANNQLIPYFPVETRVIPSESHGSADSSPARDHASKPHVLVIPPPTRWAISTPNPAASAYDASRRIEVPKMSRIGLLIDIYA